jgi:nitroimidazol reductase NimA-like FMN-containing flavoprotein (pyridoxamine 5'-phosphate oxidase superfamily)
VSRLKTKRTTLRRHPERGNHDFETIAAILDEGLVCHIGFVVDGRPFVVPTGYGRDGRNLYVHGSSASRMLTSLSGGIPICLTVTLLDGIVFGRSAFRHSMNYRSVVVLGVATELGGDEKVHGLRTITEHIARGRWADARQPNAQELKATRVLRLPVDEASAKVRSGGPIGEEDDHHLPIWAGHLPFALVPQPPVADPHVLEGVAVPPYVARYRRPGADITHRTDDR